MTDPKKGPLSQDAPSQFILDGGKDKLIQQQKFVDQGDLIPVRSFFIFFDGITTNSIIFAVHKSSLPYLGSIIGELIKIRFPVNGEDDVEWMARVTASHERDAGFWWDKGFDQSQSSEFLLQVVFEEMPKERLKTIHKVLKSKFKQVKAEKRKINFEYFTDNLFRTFWRVFLYFCMIFTVGSLFWMGVGDTVENTFGKFVSLKNRVSEKKQKQYNMAENLEDQLPSEINGVSMKALLKSAKNQNSQEVKSLSKKLNKKELLQIKSALQDTIKKHRLALEELDRSTDALNIQQQKNLKRETSSQ